MDQILVVQEPLADRLRFVCRPLGAGAFDVAAGPDTATLRHSTDPAQRHALQVEEWRTDRVVVSLPRDRQPQPAAGLHVVELVDRVPGLRRRTRVLRSAPLTLLPAGTPDVRTVLPHQLVRDDLVVVPDALVDLPDGITVPTEQVRVAFTVTPAELGGTVHIDATPLLGDFVFQEGRHVPHLVDEHGRSAPLTGVTGYGTRALTGRLPDSSTSACTPGPRTLVLRDADLQLACVVLPPPVVRLAREFRVVVTRFHCLHETYDHALQVDGQRDEVFFVGAAVRLAHGQVDGGLEVRTTAVFGDSTAQQGRVSAGSSRPEGGIRTDDRHVLAEPGEVWRGRLAQPADAVLLAPMVFEWDHHGSHLDVAQPALLPSLQQVAPGLLSTVQQATGAPLLGRLDTVHAPDLVRSVPGVAELSKADEAGHRPIGVHRKEGGRMFFRPQLVVLTFALADLLSRTGAELPVRYTEPRGGLDGDYAFWLRVEGLGAESSETDPLPGPVRTELSFTRPVLPDVRPAVRDLLDGPVNG